MSTSAESKQPVVSVKKVSRDSKQVARPLTYTNFPIFCVEWTKDNMVVLGGGGGTRGTGVESGAFICSVARNESKEAFELTASSFIDTDDQIVTHLLCTPSGELALGFGTWTAMFRPRGGDKYVLRSCLKSVPSEDEDDSQNCLAASQSKDLLATGGSDSILRLWRQSSLRPLCELPHPHGPDTARFRHVGPIQSVSFNKDASLVASCSKGDQSCRIWQTKVPAKQVEDDAAKYGVRHLVAIPGDLKSGKMLRCQACKFIEPVTSEGSRREYLLLILNASPQGPGYLALVEVTAQAATVKKKVLVSRAPLAAIQTSSDDTLVAVSANDASFTVHTLPDLAHVSTHRKCHDLAITGMCFSPDKSHILTTSADRTIKFWPTRPRRCPQVSGSTIFFVIGHLVMAFIFTAILLRGTPYDRFGI